VGFLSFVQKVMHVSSEGMIDVNGVFTGHNICLVLLAEDNIGTSGTAQGLQKPNTEEIKRCIDCFLKYIIN
jgi:hypothetical protein